MCRFLSFALGLLLALHLSPRLLSQEQKANSGLDALVSLLAQSEDPQFQYDILKGMSEGLKGRRGVTMPAGWEDLAKKLNQSPNAQVRELAQSLSLTFGSLSALNELRTRLIDSNASDASRKSAVDALLQAKDPRLPAILQKLLKDPPLRASALRGLAAYDDPATPGVILQSYPTLPAADKHEALNTLSSRLSFAKELLAAVDKNRIPRHDLTADVVRQLR